MKKRGVLIVIDGADGTGKATQVKLLLSRLKKEGHRAKSLDFPQYEKNFFGGLIGRALTGLYGDFIALDPHIASVLYAADRFESKATLEKWLAQGFVVVLDRFVSANQIHQGGKIADAKKRKKFLEWLEKMEFGVFGLPKPDVILYLDVPIEVSEKLLGEKTSFSKKQYAKGKKDLAESDAKHQRDARVSALKMIQKNNHWVKIPCAERGVLLAREVIAERIWQRVRTLKKL
ncbi:MAG: thymidylate kinase [Candidatus Moraniibacteriota bacterium]